jgi:hypothetical protein
MSFFAPGWIGLAALASIAIAAIHLIAWRLPRTMVLPTARFVPDEPARRAARTVRPSDLALLALRIAILMAAGLALARPVFESAPSGVATVVAVERANYGAGVGSLRDSLRSLPRADVTSFVLFDTAAATVASEDEAIAGAARTGGNESSLTVGLITAIREARALSRDYQSVRIVLVSSFASETFDNAIRDVRRTWPDSIRIVRIPAATPAPVSGSVQSSSTSDDAVLAGIRLAKANGLLKGESRVVRDAATAADSAWVDSGRVLVLWPRAEADAEDRVDGVHAGGFTAIGYFIPTSARDSGRIMARWVSGHPATREISLRSGCIRTVGFDVPEVGDFTITPSFQRLLSVLIGPCGGLRTPDVAPDSVLAELAAPPTIATGAITRDDLGTPNRVAAIVMTVAILLALIELGVRRSRRASIALEANA